MSEKRCPACGQVRWIEYFHRNRSTSDGRATQYKPCARAAHRRYIDRLKSRSNDEMAALYAEQERLAIAKTCSACKVVVPLTNFHKDRSRSDGRGARCHSCANPFDEVIRRYGIDVNGYEALLASQGDKCAICKTSSPGGKGRWHVDHDHACCPEQNRSCGACVRGLLCHQCNAGLGMFRDDPTILISAIRYLQPA